MNPNPIVGLNHCTVPVGISVSNVDCAQYGSHPSTTRIAAGLPNAAGIPAPGRSILQAMGNFFDQTDFSVAVKNRAPPPRPWRWEIYRAGRKSPIECSSVLYETVEAASRAGKEVLNQLLTEFPD